eukprot:11745265-Alexandrium_andersonii.AAC.1
MRAARLLVRPLVLRRRVPIPREGKLASSRPGQYATYIEDRARKYCTVGKVVTVVKAEEAVAAHRHRRVMDGRLRV